MAVKTLTITEAAYISLRKTKQENESFSEVILRLSSGKKSVVDFLGLLRDSEQPAEELQKKAAGTRKRISASIRKRHDSFRHFSSN